MSCQSPVKAVRFSIKAGPTTPDGATKAAKVLERAKDAGLTTCIDLVSMPHPRFPEIVASAAPFVDVLIANEIEAALATGGKPSSETEDLLSAGKSILAMGVQQAVVIHCVERVIWIDAAGTERVFEVTPLPAKDIVSNLGAGDAFCAGLLYGLHENLPPKQSIGIATATARASLKGFAATSAIPPLNALELTQ